MTAMQLIIMHDVKHNAFVWSESPIFRHKQTHATRLLLERKFTKSHEDFFSEVATSYPNYQQHLLVPFFIFYRSSDQKPSSIIDMFPQHPILLFGFWIGAKRRYG